MVPKINSKIIDRGAEKKITFSENIGIITDDDFKTFLNMDGIRSETYKKFQKTMDLIYLYKRKSNLEGLIEIWTESQKYFHFLG